MEITPEFQGKLFYGYESFLEDLKVIRNTLPPLDKQTDVFIGISRGGLLPAVMLSNKFGVDMVPLRWSFRDSNLGVAVDEDLWLKTCSAYERVFIIEDICDSGQTLQSMMHLLNSRMSPILRPEVYTYCLWYNTQSGVQVTKYLNGIDRNLDKRFIIFPWESLE